MAEPLKWTDIAGWLEPEEGKALQGLAFGNCVLEIGAWLGRSTVCMALSANHVTSIDWHRGDDDTGPADTLAAFRANLIEAGVAGQVTVVAERIETAGPAIPDASFDLVFVDGQHDADSVERDTRLALRVVKPGGVTAWHDANYPSVQAGVQRLGLTAVPKVGSLAWIRPKG